MPSLEIIVRDKLHKINNAAITAVALVKKSPAVRENIKLSCDIPIPKAPPSVFCTNTKMTSMIASITFIVSKII